MIKTTVQRRISDEETVAWEGEFADPAEANIVVQGQLQVCRAHMIALNEEIRAIHERKITELDSTIEARGAELKKLEAELALVRQQLDKKRLRSA